MITKALLYCTLNNLVLLHCFEDYKDIGYHTFKDNKKHEYWLNHACYDDDCKLNGHVVAVCDIEVEEIEYHGGCYYDTNKVASYDLQFKSCLNCLQLDKYLKHKNGYAIHIKNLKVFDEPLELGTDKYHAVVGRCLTLPKKAPQNMCSVSAYNLVNGCYISMPSYVLISIQPQWLVKILNGEKKIEVRKKVLKEMLCL